ncbi:heptaprenyl diphosphate synthase component 1 [Cytobacillus sp. Hz8]|uniref:heptaprenyl diphosphate synthase component 1 n=1 Tax=Cytobacillus sp. Hz8 TaxID=3347168 RepID=UPI0035D947A4
MTLTIQDTFNHVKKQIEKRVLHPYLIRFITSPKIDQQKLLILTSMLQKLGLTKNQLETYAVTTMLIQIALDTHDTVKTDENQEQRNLQLTVLAGDYYSGLYYKILAENKDIDLIRILAEGIKDVNEQKINLYQKEFKHMDDLMECVKKIESALFTKINHFFHCSSWNPFVQNFLLLKRLLAERKYFLQRGNSIVIEGMNRLIQSNNCEQVNNSLMGEPNSNALICDYYIELIASQVEMESLKIPFINESLQQTIQSLLFENKQLARTLAEEG